MITVVYGMSSDGSGEQTRIESQTGQGDVADESTRSRSGPVLSVDPASGEARAFSPDQREPSLDALPDGGMPSVDPSDLDASDVDTPRQRKALVALSLVSGIGPSRVRALIAHLNTPVDVWRASRSRLVQVPGIGPQLAEAILLFDGHDVVARQLRRAQSIGASLITPWDARFPGPLRHIYDPPAFFWMRGTLAAEDERAVAVVGTRRCTDYGTQQAYRFATELAQRGITVVSGLAYGVDAAAHRGALDAGGRTLAVLGSGLERVYPAKHRGLAERIVEQGAVLSEYALDAPPDATNFPERNRIVSGLSMGTLVIESHAEGGALITARMALEQNREVFAVPGSVTASSSAGTNHLIQQGHAKLVTGIDDVLEELQLPAGGAPTRAAAVQTVAEGLDGAERRLYEALSDTPVHLDVLCARTDVSPSDALVALLQLEFDGHVRQLAGKQFRRT